jgi:lysophospholipase L1-like esterase
MRASTFQKLTLLVVALALSLLAAEALLRGLPRPLGASRMDAWPWVVFDPIRGWQNEAGYQHPDFRIDARGFRASPFAPPTGRTAARALRIVCLGDSRTFGVWRDRASIRFDADYPSRLEAEIRRFRRGPLEVINAGVIGYSSSNGLHQYVTRILDLGPDVVIATFGFNDHLLSFAPARRIEESRNPLARQLRYALSSSALYRLAEGTRQSIGFLHPKPFSVRWVTPERYAENLRRFGEVSRENGIRLLLLAFPLRPIERGDSVQSSRHPDRNPYAGSGVEDLAGLHRLHDSYRDVLRRTAQEEEVALLELDEIFVRHAAREEYGAYDLVHFNVAGADVVAQATYARLRSLGWLDADRSSSRSATRPDRKGP